MQMGLLHLNEDAVGMPPVEELSLLFLRPALSPYTRLNINDLLFS